MKALVLALLIGSSFPQTLVALQGSSRADPKTKEMVIAPTAQSQIQHRQTDSEFLSERARRSAPTHDLIADLKAIQLRLRALKKRLQSLANARASAAAQTNFLEGGQAGTAGAQNAEKRIPQTLKHRDRAVSEVDDYGRIKVKMSALYEAAQSERVKLRQMDKYENPNPGPAGDASTADRSSQVRFGDGVHGDRLPKSDGGDPAGSDEDLQTSQQRITQLQLDVDTVEREIEDLERGDNPLTRKKPGRLK